MPKAKGETNIPLRCSLCPKNPQFSDVSHLLTHISSKSHLSHRFKLQIRAQSEMSSKEQLDDFDNWYSHNNLDVMLADRMAAKEHKKNTKERKNRVSAAPLKKEKRELTAELPLADTPVFRAPVPRMHLWPTNSTSQSSASMDEWDPDPIYATPTTRRSIPNFAMAVTPVGSHIDPTLGTLAGSWNGAGEDSGNPKGKLSDSMKLKGVQWPGMDLFDSATPEMKRMRNQRKDTSVLELMMATSAEITADETVYNTDGTISHIRDIFGPLSCETTPNREPTPKKRKPRKQALANLDVNAPRIRASRSRKTPVVEGYYKEDSPPEMRRLQYDGLPYKPTPTLNPLANFGRRFSDDDDEFTMTMGDMGHEGGVKKRSFNIFQDAPEVSPVRTESPLEEPRFDFPNSILPLPSYPNKSPANMISPTPVVKATSMRIFGKENGQSEHPSQIHVRRTTTTSHIYPPQVFYDPMFSNPLFNPYHQSPYRRSVPHTSQPQFQDHKSPPGYGSTFPGSYNPMNPLSRGSPSKQGYVVGNQQAAAKDPHSMPARGAQNSHARSGHGPGSGTAHQGLEKTSHSSSSHGAPNITNALFHGD